jgi:hypothetical protein
MFGSEMILLLAAVQRTQTIQSGGNLHICSREQCEYIVSGADFKNTKKYFMTLA